MRRLETFGKVRSRRNRALVRPHPRSSKDRLLKGGVGVLGPATSPTLAATRTCSQVSTLLPGRPSRVKLSPLIYPLGVPSGFAHDRILRPSIAGRPGSPNRLAVLLSHEEEVRR